LTVLRAAEIIQLMTYTSHLRLTLWSALAVSFGFLAPAHAQGNSSPCTPVAEAEFGDPIVCTGVMKKGGHKLAVRLYWDILADTDELHIVRIETAKTPTGKARSVIADVDSRAPMTMEANGFEFGDFNFDGYTDFRLIEFLPAGPNIAYFNAIYDPKAHKHVVAADLNALSAPTFNSQTKQVVSEWRGNAVTHGRDVFAWDGADLILRERVVSMFADDSNCMATTYEPVGRVTAGMLGSGDSPESLLKEVYEAPCS